MGHSVCCYRFSHHQLFPTLGRAHGGRGQKGGRYLLRHHRRRVEARRLQDEHERHGVDVNVHFARCAAT